MRKLCSLCFPLIYKKKALIAINTYNSLKDSEEKQKAIQPVFLQAIKSADIATIQLLSHYVAINRYFQNPEEKSNTETTYLMQSVCQWDFWGLSRMSLLNFLKNTA